MSNETTISKAGIRAILEDLFAKVPALAQSAKVGRWGAEEHTAFVAFALKSKGADVDNVKATTALLRGLNAANASAFKQSAAKEWPELFTKADSSSASGYLDGL